MMRSEYSANLALQAGAGRLTIGANFYKHGPALARRQRRGFLARLIGLKG